MPQHRVTSRAGAVARRPSAERPGTSTVRDCARILRGAVVRVGRRTVTGQMVGTLDVTHGPVRVARQHRGLVRPGRRLDRAQPSRRRSTFPVKQERRDETGQRTAARRGVRRKGPNRMAGGSASMGAITGWG